MTLWNYDDETNAFSLLELLVVIAIIAVLAAISIPMTKRAIESGRAAGCVSNLRQIGVALNLYLAEHNATMPVLDAGRRERSEDRPVIDNTLDKYAGDSRVFACPSDSQGIASASGTSYYWNVALNGQALASLHFLFTEEASRIPVISDKQGFHPYTEDKVNLLYADGHATKDIRFFTNGQ